MKRKFSACGRTLPALVVIGCAFVPRAGAQTSLWIHDGDGLWSDSSNWDNGSPNSAAIDAIIDDGDAAVTVQLDASRTVRHLSLGADDTLVIQNSRTLTVAGDILNDGILLIAGTNSATGLTFASDTLLGGSGEVRFLGGTSTSSNRIIGNTGITLTIGSGQTIRAVDQGSLGVNAIQVVNEGLVTADGAGATAPGGTFFQIDPQNAGAGSFTNNGILRAENGGVLSLTGSGLGGFTNNGGIEALDGSEVRLTTNATLAGGTYSTTGSGVIRVNAGQSVFLSDFSNTGNIIADNNSAFGIGGTVDHSGSILIEAGANATDIVVQAGGAAFSGGGTVTLSGANAGIRTTATGTRLTNVDNVIQGEGRIGQNNTAFTNQAGGIIHANVNGGILTLDPVSESSVIDSGPSFLNEGILRASNGGILLLTGSGLGSFTNTNRIEALDGSEVRLTTEARVTGGTLATSGSGIIRANANQNVYLANLTLAGNVISDNNTDFGIGGAIHNTGSITIDAGANATDLEVQPGGATLGGGGTVTLSGANAGINSASTGTRLTNVDNVIQGEGRIGQNNTAFTNQAGGIIHANVNGGILTLDPVSESSVIDSDPSFLNQGILRAGNGGVLSLTGSGFGAFTNEGTIEALDQGLVQMVVGAVLTNNVAGVLSGGTYRAVDGGNSAELSFLGAPVTTLGTGTVVDLSGANSWISFSGNALSNTLATNDGTLILRNGRVFDNVNALANNGTLDLRGGAFSSPALTNASTGLIHGFGNVNVRPDNAGAVVADGGPLVFSNGIAASGTSSSVTVNAGASLDLSGGASGSSTAFLAHHGSDLDLGSNDIVVSSDYTNGNFGVGNGFEARANVSGSGLILAAGNTTQTITGDGAGGTISFGNVHVGDSVTKNYQIANTGSSGPALRGAIQTAVNGGNITDSRIGGTGATAGNFGPITTGSDSGDLAVTFTASSAGALSGQTIRVENNFGNVAGSDIALTGAAYRLAEASVAPAPVDFGIIHVGDTVLQNLTITNTAVNDGFSERLVAGFGGATSGITGSGSISGLAAGGTDATSIGISVDTGTAGFIDGLAFLDLSSDGTGTSGLGVTGLDGLQIAVTAQVNHYAAPVYFLGSGAATFSFDPILGYLLDFGTVLQNEADPSASLLIANDTLGPADTLAGSFLYDAVGFSLGGFETFSGLEAGNTQSGFLVSLNTSDVGSYEGEVLFNPRSQNASGFDGELGQVRLTLRGTVMVPEPGSAMLAALAFAAAMARRRRG